MGQYYKPMSLDTKEYLVSHKYGNGLKLMEHSYYKNNFVAEVIHLLMNEWNTHQVLWSGDYSDNADYEWNENIFNEINFQKYNYSMTDYGAFKNGDLSEEEYEKVEKDVENITENYAFVNYDKEIYCKLDCCPVINGWQISPIPLLLANSNGRGGGDYRSEHDYEKVGSWAYDKVGIIPNINVPTSYKKVEYNFHE